MDFFGQILWFAMFGTPILTIPLAWRLMDTKKIYRVIVGFLFALILSFLFITLVLQLYLEKEWGQVDDKKNAL